MREAEPTVIPEGQKGTNGMLVETRIFLAYGKGLRQSIRAATKEYSALQIVGLVSREASSGSAN
jgi:hypothetical protein